MTADEAIKWVQDAAELAKVDPNRVAVCNAPIVAAVLAAEVVKLREALTRITKIKWGWDGDCGAVAIAENALP